MLQPVVDEFVRSPIATLGGVAAILSVIIALVLTRKDSQIRASLPVPTDQPTSLDETPQRPFVSYPAVIARSLFVLAAVCGFAMVADRLMEVVDWKILAAVLLLYALSAIVSAYLLSVLLSPWILQNYRTVRLKGGAKIGAVHNVPYAKFVTGFAGVVMAINASMFFVFCVESLFTLWWTIMGNPSLDSTFGSFFILPGLYSVGAFGLVSIPLFYAIKFMFRTQLTSAAHTYHWMDELLD